MEPLTGILTLLYIFLSIATASTLRFGVLLRNYLFASLVLALLFLLLGHQEGSAHLLSLGVLTVVVKVILIPLVLVRSAHTTPTISSLLKPAAMRLLGMSLLVAITLLLIAFPNEHLLGDSILLSGGAFACIAIALFALLLARGLYGQLFQLLMIENAFVLLLFAMDIEVPLMIEFGLACTALFAVLILAILRKEIRKAFGAETVDQLSDLAE
jgi:hydrogenase-4 membrane subunit HyfE